jgi:copper chaperone
MLTLQVPDMSCGHCSGVISKAVKALDPNATIGFDMHNRLVQVETALPAEPVLTALDAAGYPATLAYCPPAE